MVRNPLYSSAHSGRTRAAVLAHSSRLGAKRRSGLGFQVLSLGGLWGGGFSAAHGVAPERDDMGVVHESVADGVGDCWITESFVPSFRRQL